MNNILFSDVDMDQYGIKLHVCDFVNINKGISFRK